MFATFHLRSQIEYVFAFKEFIKVAGFRTAVSEKAMTVVEDYVYLQLYARAPAPCRDYYGLTVSSNLVILNIWNISHGPHVYPKRQKTLLSEFHEDKYLQGEIRRLFGKHVLIFVTELAEKARNLQLLPARIFLRILRLLAANDILRLSQTSKIFFECFHSFATRRRPGRYSFASV